MSRHDEREIISRLAATPTGEPPAELLARLRADIPNDLTAGLAVADDATPAEETAVLPLRRRGATSRSWLAAAAMLLMLVGGGFLAWKLTQEVGPLERTRFDGPVSKATSDAGESAGRMESGEESILAPPASLDSTGGAENRAEQELEPAALGTGTDRRTMAEDIADAPSAAATAEFEEGVAERELTMPTAFYEEVTVVGKEAKISTSSAGSATYRTSPSPVEAPALDPPSIPPPPKSASPRRRPPRSAEIDRAQATDEVPGLPNRQLAERGSPPKVESGELVFADEAASAAAEKALRALSEEIVVAIPSLPLPPVNPVVETTQDRLSTFGLDVDTGSYTLIRAHLEAGRVPPPQAVRVEEVVNAMAYADPFAVRPARPGETFRILADGAPTPFMPSPGHRLLRFRIAARDLPPAERKPVVLTLVVDVSGSMEGRRLALVRAGIERLLDTLRPADRVALVVFANQARVAAPHGEPASLARAVADLGVEGGTNAEAGLLLGYELARAAYSAGAANRVMLLSDGVANLGATGPEAILEGVAAAAADGIELTTVGVGMGDFNDALLETLADRGDGRYAYVDGRREIERLFAEELDGTLQTVAEEARAQVEFDPRVVESWRQLGYENRALADHEFRYDAVDAGEIGPGHSVTALYEVKLRAQPVPGRPLALVKLRWREPAGAGGEAGPFREVEQRLTVEDLAPSWSAADRDLRLAAVAAELAEQLRGSHHAGTSAMRLLTEARRLADGGGATEAPTASRPPESGGAKADELLGLIERWTEQVSEQPAP